MTEINSKINSTQAGQIAKQLDKNDGNEDSKISASIWNDFVKDKGGKTITNYISLENAMKSISTYLYRNANKAGQTVKNLAESWLNKEVEANKTATTSTAQAVDSSNQSNPVQRPKNAPPLKVEYPPVPPKGRDLRECNQIELSRIQGEWAKSYKENAKEVTTNYIEPFLSGKGIENSWDGGKQVCIDKLNNYNVAYIIQNLGDLLFESDKGKALLEDLIKNLKTRANELKIEIPENMNKEGIIKLAQAIIDDNESAINEMNAMQSMQTPNPNLAGKDIYDKASGHTYHYDSVGVISEITETNTEGQTGLVFFNKGDFSWDRRGEFEYRYDNNGNIIFYLTDGISRNAEGCVVGFYSEDLDTWYDVDPNTGEIIYSETEPSGDNAILLIYRDKDGNLIEYRERDESGNVFLDKRPDGTTYRSYDTSYEPSKYYDANGKEISVEEWEKLTPTDS